MYGGYYFAITVGIGIDASCKEHGPACISKRLLGILKDASEFCYFCIVVVYSSVLHSFVTSTVIYSVKRNLILVYEVR